VTAGLVVADFVPAGLFNLGVAYEPLLCPQGLRGAAFTFALPVPPVTVAERCPCGRDRHGAAGLELPLWLPGGNTGVAAPEKLPCDTP